MLRRRNVSNHRGRVRRSRQRGDYSVEGGAAVELALLLVGLALAVDGALVFVGVAAVDGALVFVGITAVDGALVFVGVALAVDGALVLVRLRRALSVELALLLIRFALAVN